MTSAGCRGRISGVFDDLLDIAQILLRLAFTLFDHAFDLLVGATDQLASFLLDVSSQILDSAFDLVFVHDELPWLNETICRLASLCLRLSLKVMNHPTSCPCGCIQNGEWMSKDNDVTLGGWFAGCDAAGES
jgi:hypothetical protein